MSIRLFPAPHPINGNVTKMQFHEISRFRAAAQHARRLYPGPLGELVFRELNAYADFGCRFSSDDRLIPRLAATILATRSDHHHTEAGQPGP